MSSQGFTFPPPPPPPPTTHQPPANPPARHGQNTNGRGVDQRGRGRGHGNRGRGGNHTRGGRPPSYNPSGPAAVAQPGYGGHIPQALPPAPYLPPSPYHHGQPPAFPNLQTPSSFHPQQFNQPMSQGHLHHQTSQHPLSYPQQFGQSGTAGSYPQHIPGNSSPPGYMQGLPASPHVHQANAHGLMNSTPWHHGMQGVGSYMAPQTGKARRSSHVDQGSNARTQKRDRSSAFKPQSTVPRTPAAPAVPSFGNPLPSKPPLAADTAAGAKSKRKRRKHNQLGLTPHANDPESSDDEGGEDEESRLALNVSEKAPLEVSYKGRTSKLESESDIAAWIAERKKRFPTQARIAEKKKAAEEANKAREAARQEKNKEQQKKRKDIGHQKSDRNESYAEQLVTSAERRETIRRDLEREEQRILKAVAETEAARLRLEALKKEALRLNADSDQDTATATATSTAQETSTEHHNPAPASAPQGDREDSLVGLAINAEPQDASPDISNSATAIEAEHAVKTELSSHEVSDDAMDVESNHEGSDWTSSSGSGSDSDSGSDNDDAPEQASSRRTGPERVPPPPREGKKTVCRYFARNGHCNRGDQCKFLHENEASDRTPKSKMKPTEKKDKDSKRKGLYQALLDRQKEDEDRRAMEVISWLGQHNMLAPDQAAPHDTPII